MASEIVSGVQQQPSPGSHTLITSSSTANNSAIETKQDSVSDKISRNSSSGEDDIPGNLVIDTDDDSEKVNKETKPFFGFQENSSERKSPARNNNNNNSVVRSLCSSKHIGHVEKDSSSNKNLSSNSGNTTLPSSFPPTAGFTQSGKVGKTKSKKSAKSNKSITLTSMGNSSTSESSSSTSSPAGSFISALDTDSNHLSSFDSKAMLPRTSSSPDENSGKKNKSNKSKYHHKKPIKHSEKSNYSSSSIGGKSDNEKIKSKSKHNANTSATSTSSISTFSLSPEAHDSPSRSAINLPARSATEKISSGSPSTTNQRFSDVTMTNTTSSNHRSIQVSTHGRVPARTASIVYTTGKGAKVAHACNERESSESEAPVGHDQTARKKHKKVLSVNSNNTNTSDSGENVPSREFNYQSQFGNTGKRDRNSANITAATSGNETSKSKKMKYDADGKLPSSRVPSASTAIDYPRPIPQINVSVCGAETSPSVIGTSLTSSQVGLRTKNGEAGLSSAAHNTTESNTKAMAPRVFAPSNNFAHSLPRYNVTNPADLNPTSRSSKENLNMPGGSAQTEPSSKTADVTPQLVTSQRTVGTLTSTSDIGVMTEPDSLGPCEPGTSVHLDGIVWHETDTGVLVVNVTWRNRTYVGSLLDATKHDWAPPRFSDSDLDIELRGKNNRPKRSRAAQGENNRKGRSRGSAQSVNDDIKGSPSAAAKRRNKNSESEILDNDGASTPRSSVKRPRIATPRGTKDQQLQPEESKAESNGGSSSSTCSSPVSFDCPHPKCAKKYKQASALTYHQAHAHGRGFSEDDNKETNDEETGTDAATSSPEQALPDAFDSETPMVEERTSMKHPLADLTAPESSKYKDEEMASEGQYRKLKSSLHPKEEEKKSFLSLDPKIHAKDHPQVYHAHKEDFPPSSSHTDSSNVTTEHSSGDTPVASIPAFHHHTTSSSSSVSATSRSSVPFIAVSSSNRMDTFIQQTASESTAADNESALAVEALLQIQNTDDSSLPGLSSYNQDSPHPTLSLGSRPSPAPVQEHLASAEGYLNRSCPHPSYPLSSSVEQRSFVSAPLILQNPASKPVTVSSIPSITPFAMLPNPTLNRTQLGYPLPSTSPSLAPPQSHNAITLLPPKEQIFDSTQKHSTASSLSKENYTVSVSNIAPTSAKIAKGKTVPIPVDPDHSLLVTASVGLANSAKKMKRKKKIDGKSSGSPESSPVNEMPYPSTQDPTRSQHGSPEAPIPIASSSDQTSVNSPSMSSRPSAMPLKLPNPLVQGSDFSSTSGPPNDPNRRHLPQHHVGGNRKVHGIISPVSSSTGNNITVTGTFHPHPDPHKPQTAVSALAQDKNRTSRPSSPISSNKINNNKLGPAHGGTAGRPHHLPKPGPPSVVGCTPQNDKASIQDQESDGTSRTKGPEFKSHSQLREASINHMQNQVENTIASAYSKELSASRVKPAGTASPIPAGLRPRDSPTVPSELTSDPRPVIINEDIKTTPQKSVPRASVIRPGPEHVAELQKCSPSPRPKPITDPQMLPNNQQQAAYAAQLYNPMFGMSFVHTMDPAAYQQAATSIQARYMSDPPFREQYDRYCQEWQKQQQQYLQQQLLTQHQQGDKKTRKPEEKEHSKPAPPPLAAENEQAVNWQQLQQHSQAKRVSMGSPSLHQQLKEKQQNLNPMPSVPPHAPPANYRSLQSHHQQTPPQDPTRSHSVAPSNPSHHQTRPHHVRSESLDRGRSSIREERRVTKPAAPLSVKIERSPEKIKEKYPSRGSPSTTTSGHMPYYPYTIFDPNRPPYPAGVPHYPGITHGYVFPPGAPPVLHPQAGWIPGAQQPPSGKHSPPLKPPKDNNSPNRFRSSSREDIKPKEVPGLYAGKEARNKQVSDIASDRKYTISPEPKPVITSPASRKSVPTVSSELPTQMHHHTHHHIHGGVLPVLPPQYYPGAPVGLGGPDAVAPYPVSFQKRERPTE